MKQKLELTFFNNHNEVPVGELSLAGKRMLATTHPATIAAAIFAMDHEGLSVKTTRGECEIGFPVLRHDLENLGAVAMQEQAHFLSLFATFSYFDFANPEPWDDQADIHFRTAVHHLAPELIKVRPNGPEPKGWRRALRKRNQFVYYPHC